MTLLSTLVTDAFRESNLVAVGATETTAQRTEALRLLNVMISAFFGHEIGSPLVDVTIGSEGIVFFNEEDAYAEETIETWFVPDNYRLNLNLSEGKGFRLNPSPTKGARLAVKDVAGNLSTTGITLYGNGRLIEGAESVSLITNGASREWFYRPDTSNWVKTTDLIISDESPFPSKYDDLLTIGLALRIAGRYGVAATQEQIAFYNKALRKFRADYNEGFTYGLDEALMSVGANKKQNLRFS